MQDQYAGDIGDFIKLGLLRCISHERKLAVAWYHHPSETHKADGKHIGYLKNREKWRSLDPQLFDALEKITETGRSIEAIERASLLAGPFHSERLAMSDISSKDRSVWRSSWFQRLSDSLGDADLVFADPDNGLVDDNPSRRTKAVFGKQIPLSEAKALATKRAAIIYHHNTRRVGGHELEAAYWIGELGVGTMAVRTNALSCRTFFVVNPDHQVRDRVESFCSRWGNNSVWLQT